MQKTRHIIGIILLAVGAFMALGATGELECGGELNAGVVKSVSGIAAAIFGAGLCYDTEAENIDPNKQEVDNMIQSFGRFYWDDETGDVFEDDEDDDDDYNVDLEIDRLIEQRHGID